MPHNPGVTQKPLHIGFIKPRDTFRIETGKSGPERLALGQNGPPAQTGLKAFQTKLFKQPPVIGDGKSPFMIVIGFILFRRRAPRATRLSVPSRNGLHPLLLPCSVRLTLKQDRPTDKHA